jgi:hypothetical protein
MYTTNYGHVKLPGGISDSFKTTIGIKQGDSLSPLLFSLFIDDLTHILNENEHPPNLANEDINSLLYADDLVLLSTTETGLQNSINKLNKYCKTWHLKINLTKTKILNFSKNSKLQNNRFTLGETPIKHCNEYTYLGIQFQQNGSLRNAALKLKEKALKAWFSIRSTTYSNDSYNPDILIRLFDTLIKPIILYGAEITGQEFIKSFNLGNNKWENTPFEQLHNRACRNILGIRNNGSGKAAKADLGRYPLLINIAQASINYYKKVLSDPNKLTYSALLSERELAQNCSKSWVGYIDKILQLSNLSYTIISQRPKLISSTLKSLYTQNFFSFIQSKNGIQNGNGNKLRTYAIFKRDYTMDKYLKCSLSKNITSAIAKLRTSTHNLAIETGRYVRPKLPPERRICKCCNLNLTENEIHFIFNCPAYEELRQDLSYSIAHLQTINNENEKLWYIMNLENYADILVFGIFICKANMKRKNILNGI